MSGVAVATEDMDFFGEIFACSMAFQRGFGRHIARLFILCGNAAFLCLCEWVIHSSLVSTIRERSALAASFQAHNCPYR